MVVVESTLRTGRVVDGRGRGKQAGFLTAARRRRAAKDCGNVARTTYELQVTHGQVGITL